MSTVLLIFFNREKHSINWREKCIFVLNSSLNSPWASPEVIIFVSVLGLVLSLIKGRRVLTSFQNIQEDKHILSMTYAPLVQYFQNKQTQSESIFLLKEEASNKCLLSWNAVSPCAGSEIAVLTPQCYPCNLLTPEPTTQTEIASPYLCLCLCMSGLRIFSALTTVLQEMDTTSQICWVFSQFIPPMEGLMQCLWGIFLSFELAWVVKQVRFDKVSDFPAGNARVGPCSFSCSLAKEGSGKQVGQFPCPASCLLPQQPAIKPWLNWSASRKGQKQDLINWKKSLRCSGQ